MTALATKNRHINLTQTWLVKGTDLVQIYLYKLLNDPDFDHTIPIVDPDLARRWIALVSAFGLLFSRRSHFTHIASTTLGVSAG
jgi:hypothetical protein